MFLTVGYIPELTARAMYPQSDNESDIQELKRAGCRTNHESALDKAIDSGIVTLLNPLSLEAHTFPYGDARKRAVIYIDDFKRFAESLQIEVVILDESDPTQDTDDVAGAKPYLTIEEAASALANKYNFNENTKDTMQRQIFEATEGGELVVRHPQTLLPYTPNPRRDFYELVSVTDLNKWLEDQGVEYRLDPPEQEQHELGTKAQGSIDGLIDRNKVMACFAVKPDSDENLKFWDNRLASPSNALLTARKFPGKAGTSALWEPLGIAHYLLGGKGVKQYMSLGQLDVVMEKRFPELFDLWKEQTEDKRH